MGRWHSIRVYIVCCVLNVYLGDRSISGVYMAAMFNSSTLGLETQYCGMVRRPRLTIIVEDYADQQGRWCILTVCQFVKDFSLILYKPEC